MSDDGWSDEEETNKAPEYEKYVVKSDYIPDDEGAHDGHVALIRGDTVYVFSKNTDKPGIWEGEVNGVVAKFPSKYLAPMQYMDGKNVFVGY